MNKSITRTVHPDTPFLVEYGSTEYCRSFGKIIEEMISWGKEYKKIVLADN